MKKIIFTIAITVVCLHLCAQNAQWNNYSKLSCYQGFSSSSINYGYNKYGNGYEWNWKIKSNYNKTVSFDVTFKVGNDKKEWGRITLKPGAEHKHVSFYYSDASNYAIIEVSNVCFSENYLDNCYASCDNGSPNQPNCNDKFSSQSSTTYSNSSSYTNNNSSNTTNTYMEYYTKAQDAKQVGNFDAAIQLFNSAISVSVNDAQRQNAQQWITICKNAKATSSSTQQTYHTPISTPTYKSTTPSSTYRSKTKQEAQTELINSTTKSVIDLINILGKRKK